MNTVLAVVIAGIAALTILGVSLLGTDLILSRLTFTDFGSAQSRVTLAESAIEIIKDSPLIGIGLNNYSLVSHKYDLVNLKAWGNRSPVVHNAFLLVAAETGIMGLAGFIIFLGVILILAWQITKYATSNIMWVAGAGILGAMAALIVHNMVDYALLGNGRVFTQLWVLAGMAAALTLRIDSERRNASHAEIPSSSLSDELHSN
jgi:O-antigen ligase